MIWILVAIYVVILALEVPPLLKQKMYPELGAFLAFFIIGMYVSLAYYYEWPLAGPFNALMNYMES